MLLYLTPRLPYRGTVKMTAEVTAAKMALLRKLVTREAERRQQCQLQSNGMNGSRRDEESIEAGPSTVTIEDVEALEEETRQLRDMLNEKRLKNDVDWESVRQVSSLEENIDDRIKLKAVIAGFGIIGANRCR